MLSERGPPPAQRLREITGDALPAVPDWLLADGLPSQPTPLDASLPLGATRVFKNMPSLQVWRLWHQMSMRFLGGITERLLPSVRESLRWREGEQAPQVLLTLPSAPYR